MNPQLILLTCIHFRYGFMLSENHVPRDPLSISVAVLQQFNVLPEMYQVGYTKLYLRSGQVVCYIWQQLMVSHIIILIALMWWHCCIQLIRDIICFTPKFRNLIVNLCLISFFPSFYLSSNLFEEFLICNISILVSSVCTLGSFINVQFCCSHSYRFCADEWFCFVVLFRQAHGLPIAFYFLLYW